MQRTRESFASRRLQSRLSDEPLLAPTRIARHLITLTTPLMSFHMRVASASMATGAAAGAIAVGAASVSVLATQVIGDQDGGGEAGWSATLMCEDFCHDEVWRRSKTLPG
jgi:hypothetical protein